LFGHRKGSFLGALEDKVGKLQKADDGTLFLDEVGDMSLKTQAKVLRSLDEQRFEPIGAETSIQVDVRVVAATNKNLEEEIERGNFREDLFYRLNVFQIHVAPLRERPQDIVPLAEVFLDELGRTMGRPSAGISRDGREWLLAYPWPGNVRELRNAIERAILLCDGGLVTREHLPQPLAAGAPAPARNGDSTNGGTPGDMNVGSMERGLVERALAEAKGNKSKAARLLGLTRAQLYWRMDKYGIAT
jgi:transcriptional regulator with PAS, ATPase and Fis domain